MHEGKHSEKSATKIDLYIPENQNKRCTGLSYFGPKFYIGIPKNIKEAQTTKAQPMQKLIMLLPLACLKSLTYFP